MKLIELSPHWVGLMPGHALGITFLCPHCLQCRISTSDGEVSNGYDILSNCVLVINGIESTFWQFINWIFNRKEVRVTFHLDPMLYYKVVRAEFYEKEDSWT